MIVFFISNAGCLSDQDFSPASESNTASKSVSEFKFVSKSNILSESLSPILIRNINRIFAQEVCIVVASEFCEEWPWIVAANLRIVMNDCELHANPIWLQSQTDTIP